MDTAAVAAALDGNIDARLSAAEAARRFAKNGPNALRTAPVHPIWRRILKHFQDPLIYLLLVAIGIALLA